MAHEELHSGWLQPGGSCLVDRRLANLPDDLRLPAKWNPYRARACGAAKGLTEIVVPCNEPMPKRDSKFTGGLEEQQLASHQCKIQPARMITSGASVR
jgi:hypothetical protein